MKKHLIAPTCITLLLLVCTLLIHFTKERIAYNEATKTNEIPFHFKGSHREFKWHVVYSEDGCQWIENDQTHSYQMIHSPKCKNKH